MATPVPRRAGISDADHPNDVELVRRAVRASPTERWPDGTAQELSRRLRINERTVRRWLGGSSTIRDATLRQRVERIAAKAPADEM